MEPIWVPVAVRERSRRADKTPKNFFKKKYKNKRVRETILGVTYLSLSYLMSELLIGSLSFYEQGLLYDDGEGGSIAGFLMCSKGYP